MKNHNGILSIYRCLRLLLILFGMQFGNYESSAQYVTSKNADEILLDLHKLNQLGSVLYIAAHPDDENTKLLAYLSKEKHYRTGYLSLTRGDGGQNLIGEEQGVELGLIRTQELLAARKIDGAQQFFTSAFDFGYSKNPTEALKIWDHDKILGDMVWIIRNFRPDIIICRFPSTGEGGHGHHTASAMLAEEAYQAAADPTKYPDQLKLGATIWQAKRLLWNTFNFGSINTQREDQFKIDIGGYNPLLGKSYGEMAALSRSQHKSQGFGVPAQRGSAIEYFATIKGESPQKDFLDGVSSDWTALGNAQINKSIDFIIDAFNPSKPNLSVPLLLKLYKEIEKCNVPIFQKKIKLDEIKELVFQCGAVYFESVTNSKYVVSNDSVSVDVAFINRLGLPIDSVAFYWNGEVVACFDSVSTNKYHKHTLRLFISNDPTSSQPYWIRDKMGNGSFTIRNIQDLLKPENDPPIQFQMKVYLHQKPFFECTSPLLYKYTDPVIGEKYEPICIVPTITLHPKKSLNIQTSNQVPVTPIELIAYKDTSMTAIYCNGKMLDIDKPYLIKRQNKRILDMYLDSGLSIFHTEKNNSLYEIHQIQYSHIAPIYYFKECTIINKVISVKTEGKKIGYINGAGDKVKEALKQMGYEVDILLQSDMYQENLKKYDAIVTGVRAYNINEWLNSVYDTLMNYMKEGGVLLVQYNTSNSIGPLKSKIGPYPFSISRDRVTDENAMVKLVDTSLSIFNYPNKIVSDDFNGWIQERSIYHAAEINNQYMKPIRMKDPGESETDGSLIFANVGKGKFIYTGISFFRQLPAGIEGAYRLFANLIYNGKINH